MPKFISELRIQPRDKIRNTYLFVQIITASFLILTARHIYLTHPYYQGLLNFQVQRNVSTVMLGLLVLVILDTLRNYFFTEKIGPTKLTRIFALWLKVMYNVVEFVTGRRDYVKIVIDKETKVALLAMLVKFFYIPLMLSFLDGNFSGLLDNINSFQLNPVTFDSVFSLAVSALFTIDILVFTFAYVIEADFLGSRIRSVEPTMLGWVAALSTYPPFNTLPSLFFVMVQGGPTVIGQNVMLTYIVKIGILLCNFLFVASSVSLGFKASNLTNRGIVSHGTYSIVRHPAYTVKLLSWFLEGVLFAPNLGYFAGWAGFAFIYFVRAVTEERHLGQDPDYVEYKQRVKFRFIPGVY